MTSFWERCLEGNSAPEGSNTPTADRILGKASMGNQQKSRWTWAQSDCPALAAVLALPTGDWRKALADARDAVVGKVLHVCAAASISSAYLRESKEKTSSRDRAAIDLLEAWIDAPSEARSRSICELLFTDGDALPVQELAAPVWWALRTSTAHLDGCGEVEWAFEGLCESMLELGFTEDEVRSSCLEGLRSRLS